MLGDLVIVLESQGQQLQERDGGNFCSPWFS